MNTEAHKKSVRRYILGAAGGGLMAAGDWLLGCIPIQAAVYGRRTEQEAPGPAC